MNVALYGKPARWAMTERGVPSLSRGPDRLGIGASSMEWDGTALTIAIDEVTAPLPSRLRGRIVVRPRFLTSEALLLDPAGRHRWQPLAPLCDVEARMTSPELRWTGTGYFDTNTGSEPLEDTFRSWTWSRFDCGTTARIVYDALGRDGARWPLSLRVTADGKIEDAAPLAYTSFRRGFWGAGREAPADPGTVPRLVRPLEDAPFYTRSQIESVVDGSAVQGIHESLDLDRAVAPWVLMMLPFRMPRAGALTAPHPGRR